MSKYAENYNFFFSSRRRHTRFKCDWSSDVCSSDLPQHFTFSKVACWVAADAGARLAEGRGEKKLAAQWRTAAEQIRADVLAHAVDERGVFTQHYGGKALDASVLLIPLFPFLPAAHEPRPNTLVATAA